LPLPLDIFLPLAELPPVLKVFFILAPGHLFPTNPKLDRGDRFAHCPGKELGGVFVKFRQILSTRASLLPDDMADSLKTLQDKVPPVSKR